MARGEENVVSMLGTRASLLRLLATLLLSVGTLPAFGEGGPTDQRMNVGEPADASDSTSRRRVHAPYFPTTVEWAEAGVFWFGRVDPPDAPGQNYVDVRVAYTTEELALVVNIEDYYLWHETDATPESNLTQYDAVAVYLDTANDQAASPQPDDRVFLSGLCVYGCGDGSSYQREAQGTGTGWDFGWQAPWNNNTWASWWCNPGPNYNDCGIDFGWWSVIVIPWSALGLESPPPAETLWGLGVLLYDRDDQDAAGLVAPEHWPETFQDDNPSTWGELAFGPAAYAPPTAFPQGTAVIRRGLGNSTVEDAWVGGGGTCSGGHMGDPDQDNYGADTGLYVENQSLIADLTCFSKSYMRFHLDAIPPGKTILSATLTLHHWGNARWDTAQPSLIWLLTVDGDWEEHTLTWNNAPLARENLTATWVDVLTPDTFPGWPGVRYDWDATQAVAEACAAGEPLNVALYTADTNFDSSKYFSSSEAGDWNAVARPTLTVVWGEPLATVSKDVWPLAATAGQMVTYTLGLLGNGQALTLTDSLPAGLSAPGPITATSGSADYDPGQHRITWTGSPGTGLPVTVGFPVTVEIAGPHALSNTATLVDAGGSVSTAAATIIVDAWRTYLPIVTRAW
jgi:hypothetical protein